MDQQMEVLQREIVRLTSKAKDPETAMRRLADRLLQEEILPTALGLPMEEPAEFAEALLEAAAPELARRRALYPGEIPPETQFSDLESLAEAMALPAAPQG